MFVNLHPYLGETGWLEGPVPFLARNCMNCVDLPRKIMTANLHPLWYSEGMGWFSEISFFCKELHKMSSSDNPPPMCWGLWVFRLKKWLFVQIWAFYSIHKNLLGSWSPTRPSPWNGIANISFLCTYWHFIHWKLKWKSLFGIWNLPTPSPMHERIIKITFLCRSGYLIYFPAKILCGENWPNPTEVKG